MGGLKPEIANGIRMFNPKSLKEAISLSRMRDEQLTHQRKITRPFNRSSSDSPTPTKFKTASPMKRLTWDEMQKRRAQGLCFSCDEKFTPGHKCRGPLLLLLERDFNASDADEEKEEGLANFQEEPEISLHAFTGWSTARTMRVTAKV